jgi:hypothetical protein
MLWVGFEPTIPVLERAKTFHTLDCAATVIGDFPCTRYKNTEILHRVIIRSLELFQMFGEILVRKQQQHSKLQNRLQKKEKQARKKAFDSKFLCALRTKNEAGSFSQHGLRTGWDCSPGRDRNPSPSPTVLTFPAPTATDLTTGFRPHLS